MEVSFHLPNLHDAELTHPENLDPKILCSKKNARIGGVIGPFGLMVMASKNLTEHTDIFFRVLKVHDDKYVVLMCSDQSRQAFSKWSFSTFHLTYAENIYT